MTKHLRADLLFFASVAFVAIIGISAPAIATDVKPYAVGTAKLDGSDRFYYEIHYRAQGSTSEKVLYHWDNGDVIVNKTLDFSNGESTPGFKQLNRLNGEFTEVRHLEDKKLEVSYRSKTDAETITKTLEYEEPLVIDAGFDHHVRANWGAIASGKTLQFEYLVPARHMLLGMRAKKTDCENDQSICINVEVSNFVLRWLVAPLKLEYNKKTRNLTRFIGTTNISDADKNVLKADIKLCHGCDIPPEIVKTAKLADKPARG